MPEEQVGTVIEFFARPMVAGIELTGTLQSGERIHIKGYTSDFEMIVESMQLDNDSVQEGQVGQSVGIRVASRVRRGDRVYRIFS